ncbi:hypothetical protein ACSBR1_008632 [Camellia fascicularis]
MIFNQKKNEMATIIKLIEDFKAGVNSWKHVKNSFDNWNVSKKLEVADAVAGFFVVEFFLEDYTSQWPIRYSYADIKWITNQFMEKFGRGYGTVYKGMLSHEIFVAVKALNNSKGNGEDFINEVGTIGKICHGNREDFINEVGTIGKICHENIVHLVGFCADGFVRALFYEFLTNDSPEKNFGKVSYRATSQTFIVMEDCCLKWLEGERMMLQQIEQELAVIVELERKA